MAPLGDRTGTARKTRHPAGTLGRRARPAAAGFTLVEVAIALVLLGSVFAVVYRVFLRSQNAFFAQKAMVEAQQNARIALESISADLRLASYGKDATQPSVLFADVDSVAFTADVYDSIPGAETVTLYLGAERDSGTANPTDRVVHKAVYDTTGAVVLEAPIAYGIADGGLAFRYFDRDGAEFTLPVVNPERISEIEVAVTAETPREVDRGSFRSVSLSTVVAPRNLPFTPSRAKPSAPVCLSLTSPNCESMTIDWQTPTTHTDGSPLPFNDISHFNIYVGTSLGAMNLDTRVARNVNSWTVRNLDSQSSYILKVTCVANSGVESEGCMMSGSPAPGTPPQAPAGITAATVGSAVTLVWRTVSLDVGGGQIYAPVTYDVFRSLTPGSPPVPANRIAADLTDTTYVDVLSGSCGTYFYRVTASACGVASAGSSEAQSSSFADPACPTNVTAADGPGFGEVTVGWTPPSTRSDGSPLVPGDLSGYKVLFGTTSGVYPDTVWVGGGSTTSALLSGLSTCTTYFVNVMAVDLCDIPGEICAENQKVAWTTTPCDVAVPQMPTGLVVTPGDGRLDLVWATSQDCDIAGYRIYYDRTPGPPFYGTGANEGPSPVYVDFSAATVDSAISTASLTGLDPCRRYYVAVSAVDQCTPPNESPTSLVAYETPTCVACLARNACIAEYATGIGSNSAHGDVASDEGGDLTVETMSLAWRSGQTLQRVWAGGVKVWDADGSAGQDGAVPPPTSPASVDVNDWVLPSTASSVVPRHLQIDFGGSTLGDSIVVGFESGSARCSVVLEPCNVIFADDFEDDPNGPVPSNWAVNGGSWSISSRRLKSSGTANARCYPVGFPSVADFTVQATVQIAGTNAARRAGIHFRYVDSGNFYMFRIWPTYDRAEFCRKVNNGPLEVVAYYDGIPIFDSFNHTVRVSATGNTFRFWVDGNPIYWLGGTSGAEVVDASIPAGKVSLYSFSSTTAYFDNIIVYRTCGGCGP